MRSGKRLRHRLAVLPSLGMRLAGLLVLAALLGLALAWAVAVRGLEDAAAGRASDAAAAGQSAFDAGEQALSAYSAQIARQLSTPPAPADPQAQTTLTQDSLVARPGDVLGRLDGGRLEAFRDGAPVDQAGSGWLDSALAADGGATAVRLTGGTGHSLWLLSMSAAGDSTVFVAEPETGTFSAAGVVVQAGRAVTTGPVASRTVDAGSALPAPLAAAAGQPGKDAIVSFDDNSVAIDAAPLRDGYSLVVASAVGTPAGLVGPVLLFGPMIVTVLLLILLLVESELTRPLRRLQRAVAAIGEGHLDDPIPPGPRNEIGLLASDVEMTRRELHAAMRQTEAQAVIADQLNSATSLDDTLAHVAAYLRDTCHADAALILAQGDPGERDIRVAAGMETPAGPYDLLAEHNPLGDIARRPGTGAAIVTLPAESGLPSRLCCCAPVRTSDRGTGIVALLKPVFDDDDPAIVSIAAEQISDALARHRLNEAETARRAAEEASAAKSEYLSRMSHELRTPLTSIMGYSDLLGMKLSGPEEREWLKAISTSGDHLLTLIDELLDIARIEAGKETFSLEPVRLADLLNECIALIAPAAARREIALHHQLPADDLHVNADRQRLRQVLLNLLSNAVKYGSAPGQVYLTATTAGGDRVRITVQDTGPGIPEDRQPALFQPFERLGAERGSVSGPGLGLAVSRRLVEAMGGRIGLRSRPGAGSRFWVELTRVDATAAAIGREPGEKAVAADDGATPQRTILHIEDNPSTREVIAEVLSRRRGIRLIPAPEGRLGTELAHEHRPDLILLDVHLPDIDGEEVLALLKGDPATAEIPVVILSADATEHRAKRMLQAGARAYITKPFRVRRFLEMIDTELSNAPVSARAEAHGDHS